MARLVLVMEILASVCRPSVHTSLILSIGKYGKLRRHVVVDLHLSIGKYGNPIGKTVLVMEILAERSPCYGPFVSFIERFASECAAPAAGDEWVRLFCRIMTNDLLTLRAQLAHCSKEHMYTCENDVRGRGGGARLACTFCS